MHRRTTGMLLIIIAAFLYGIRYLAAAIYGSNSSTWSAELFNEMLNYVGKGPMILSTSALILGVAYMLVAELEGTSMRKQIEQIKSNWNEFDLYEKGGTSEKGNSQKKSK
ncbi:hypothetical protein [Paenibacillus fonticola]|uniref:hypothetical protein n=1 Tax=Paenibacillus fonticola TaxID=379896 RepID=UPI0003A18E69|nr:hypothetical protein [Paenibacillus fonticola]